MGYGYYIFSGTDPQGFDLKFLAGSWEDAEKTASRLGLTELGRLLRVYPASDGEIEWATARRNQQ